MAKDDKERPLHEDQHGNAAIRLNHQVIEANEGAIREMAEDIIHQFETAMRELVTDFTDGMERAKHRMCKRQGASGLAGGFLGDEKKGVNTDLGNVNIIFNTKMADIRADLENNLAALDEQKDIAIDQVDRGAKAKIVNANRREVVQ